MCCIQKVSKADCQAAHKKSPEMIRQLSFRAFWSPPLMEGQQRTGRFKFLINILFCSPMISNKSRERQVTFLLRFCNTQAVNCPVKRRDHSSTLWVRRNKGPRRFPAFTRKCNVDCTGKGERCQKSGNNFDYTGKDDRCQKAGNYALQVPDGKRKPTFFISSL